jgi:leader peptidase (prepilin peptidase)/N-methyltransferase
MHELFHTLDLTTLIHPLGVGLFVFFFGSIWGSFLNVCIYRIPAGKSVIFPGSHCACGKPIAYYDNVPILSWFILRGRARCCGRSISARYPIVEAITGILFVAVWFSGPSAKALCGFVFSFSLVGAAFIDFDTFEIPEVFSVWMAFVGVGLSFFIPALHGHEFHARLSQMAAFRESAIGVLVGSGFVLWFAILMEKVLRKEAMGMGDVKLMGMVGAFCGWKIAIAAFALASPISLAAIGLLYLRQMITGKKLEVKRLGDIAETAALQVGVPLPFGPALCTSSFLLFVLVDRIPQLAFLV